MTKAMRVHWRVMRSELNYHAMCGKKAPPANLTNTSARVTCESCLRGLQTNQHLTNEELDAAAKFIIQGAVENAAKNPSARALESLLGASVVHPDDAAVDLFAAEMKRKLAKKRTEGRGGWEQPYDETTDTGCTMDFLWYELRGHADKGDPVDVGNFAMMIYNRMRAGNERL